jgi:hypothetical protein
MRVNPLLDQVLHDEALTRGLGDAEARVLIEWLVEHAEIMACSMLTAEAEQFMKRLCRRARGIARFVSLWCLDQAYGAAGQLAVTERFTWPWPDGEVEPCELMQAIVRWETNQMEENQSLAAG